MNSHNFVILKNELQKPEYTDLVNQQNYPAIASLLNTSPMISNPLQQTMVWRCPAILELFMAITPIEALQLYQIPGLIADIRTAIDHKNKDSLNAFFAIVSSLVSESSNINLETLLNKEYLDPYYQPQIVGASIAQVLGIYPVSESDVQEVLNAD